MSFVRFPRTALIIASATLLLAACGNDKGKTATQAAARVNDGELTVHQINQLLEQQRGLKPEQVAAASKDALERLIDQELILQQAVANKVDREPKVVALIEAARRDLIVRAYMERLGETITKPSTDEVQAYYSSHPGLFANRRIYTLTEVNVQADPALADEVNTQAKASKTPAALLDWLKAKGLEHGANQSVQAAESLPLGVVEAVANTPVGGVLVLPRPQGTKLVFVEAARPEPVSLERARPAIEQFIANDRKRSAALAEVKRLRDQAKIEYLGQFAQAASGTPATPPAPAAPPASGLDDAALKKGLGLK